MCICGARRVCASNLPKVVTSCVLSMIEAAIAGLHTQCVTEQPVVSNNL